MFECIVKHLFQLGVAKQLHNIYIFTIKQSHMELMYNSFYLN